MFLEKFRKHVDYFNLTHPDLEKFEEILKISEDAYFLECSGKISGSGIFANRFNIYYTNKNYFKKNIKDIFVYLKNIDADFDYSTLKQIFDILDVSKLVKIIFGVDLREGKDSRAKIYLDIRKYPEMINLVLDLYKDEQIEKFILKNSLMFCIDLFYDGRTRIKPYVKISHRDLENKIIRKHLEDLFSKKSFALTNECKEFHISFKKDKIIHYKPYNPKKFIEHIDNRKFHEIWNNEFLDNHFIISLLEKEINEGNIRNLNFYY